MFLFPRRGHPACHPVKIPRHGSTSARGDRAGTLHPYPSLVATRTPDSASHPNAALHLLLLTASASSRVNVLLPLSAVLSRPLFLNSYVFCLAGSVLLAQWLRVLRLVLRVLRLGGIVLLTEWLRVLSRRQRSPNRMVTYSVSQAAYS